jgi:hypothetical protein
MCFCFGPLFVQVIEPTGRWRVTWSPLYSTEPCPCSFSFLSSSSDSYCFSNINSFPLVNRDVAPWTRSFQHSKSKGKGVSVPSWVSRGQGVWRCGGTLLIRGWRCRRVVNLTQCTPSPTPLASYGHSVRVCSGEQSGNCWDERNLLPLQRIRPRFLIHPVHSPFTTRLRAQISPMN